MTLEELNAMAAHHERELALMRDNLRLEGDLLRRLQEVAASHERQLELMRDNHQIQGQLHHAQMTELRKIVGEVAGMLNSIASMEGARDGDAKP